MSQFGGVERPGPWETAGDHERRIRALEAYRDCCHDIPEGILRGCPSVELAYRTPGDLTAWWRMGDEFEFDTTVANALSDVADFDLDSPRDLDYVEGSTTNRPTLGVANPNLGSADDGAVEFNYTAATLGQLFQSSDGPVADVSEWGQTADKLRSMVCWVRPKGVMGAYSQPFVGNWGMDGGGNVNRGWIIDITSLTLSFKNFNATANLTLSTPGLLTADTWYHVAVTWDGTTWLLYLDAVLVDSDTGTTAPEVPPQVGEGGSLSIGYGLYDSGVGTANHYGNGSVDEVAFYKKVLSPAEILNIFQSSGSGEENFFCTAIIEAGNPDTNPQAISSGEAEEFMVLTADGAGNTYWAFPTIEVLEDGV